jgi:hypothetical protein
MSDGGPVNLGSMYYVMIRLCQPGCHVMTKIAFVHKKIRTSLSDCCGPGRPGEGLLPTETNTRRARDWTAKDAKAINPRREPFSDSLKTRTRFRIRLSPEGLCVLLQRM